MKLRITVLVTAVAAAALAVAFLVPFATATTTAATTGTATPATAATTTTGSTTPATPATTTGTSSGMMGGGVGGSGMMGGGVGTGGMMGGGVTTGASTATSTTTGTSTTGGWLVGMWNGTGMWRGTGMWGTAHGMSWLAKNPAALKAWTQLRTSQQRAMQKWYETYKGNLTTSAAQQALHTLWMTFVNETKAFSQQYTKGATWVCPATGMWSGWGMSGMMGGQSWNAKDMWGAAYGASWLTSHPAAFGQWLAMRAKQVAGVNAWVRKYDGSLRSKAAQTALQHMNVQHRAQVKAFFTQHGLSASSSRMSYGAGGWMGLGGMWGGFGW
jgi:hypothetical protein